MTGIIRSPQKRNRFWPLIPAVLAVATFCGAFSVAWGPVAWFLFFAHIVFFATAFAGLVYQLNELWRRVGAYELAMEGAHDGMFEWNPVTKELRVGRRLLSLLGYSENFLFNTHTWLDLVHPADRARYNAAVAAHLKGETPFFYCEYRVRGMDGCYRWIAARGLARRRDQGLSTLMAGSVTEISERKEREARIVQQAREDPLTGLPNRLALTEHLSERLDVRKREAIAREERFARMLSSEIGIENDGGSSDQEAEDLSEELDQPGRMAVIFIDLDQFKDINDTRGHSVGDKLLIALARRMEKIPGFGETVYRPGGDEFILVADDISDTEYAIALADTLLQALKEPVTIGDSAFSISASAGIALCPDHGEEVDRLMSNADAAMYVAKAEGKNRTRLFNPGMAGRLHQQVRIEDALRQAIPRQELGLVFQPVFSLQPRYLAGAEVLLRWQHDGEMISPDRLIPVAERTGQMGGLGNWVLEETIRIAAEWRRTYRRVPALWVNISPAQFSRRFLLHDIRRLLDRHNLPPEVLGLEIRESVLAMVEGDPLHQLAELKTAGFGIALDDFGGTSSSFTAPGRLPIDRVKLSRKLVSALETRSAELEGDLSGQALVRPDLSPFQEKRRQQAKASALIRSALALAESLELPVVATGVETVTQDSFLLRHGCQMVQGFLSGAPMDQTAFAARFFEPLDDNSNMSLSGTREQKAKPPGSLPAAEA